MQRCVFVVLILICASSAYVQCANIATGYPEPRECTLVCAWEDEVGAGGRWEPIIVRQPGLNGVWQS
ncbi:hypothetical protein E2C01_068674 [Portunus trituberculatus]|uniref:Secreted protein n=1 Tax=Portunus trituberculatus TaxID=210409 RepID=A0A5B7HYI9_PORTR|nr:hypothetical protein [Portunus trituberculatus]